MQGLEAEVDGHDVAMTMPKRGWSRDDRRMFVSIDGEDYVARPRTWASAQLVRPDGSPVWRSNFVARSRLASDITPIEMTVAALIELGDFHTRMVHQPLNVI